MTQDSTREASILDGGPRDGRAYWTDDLDRERNAYRSLTEGYVRTAEFVSNEKSPDGTARVWKWTQ